MQVNNNLPMNQSHLHRHHQTTSGLVDDYFIPSISVFNFSRSTLEDYKQQIKQLQRKLSENEDERSLLRERLNEVELEFRQTMDDRSSTMAMYEQQLQSRVQERNALANQHQIQLTEK